MALRGKTASKKRYAPLAKTEEDVSAAYVKDRYAEDIFRALEIKVLQPTRLVELTANRKQRYEEGTGKRAARSVAAEAKASKGGKRDRIISTAPMGQPTRPTLLVGKRKREEEYAL